jgi:hypothetical protein
MTLSRLSVRRAVELTLAMVLLAVGGAGCAPQILGAQAVGGGDPHTWVYIRTDDRNENGIFRCHDTPQGPSCTKAKMHY